MQPKLILSLITLIPLYSCSYVVADSSSQKELDDKVSKMSQCEKVQALIKSHENGFKKVSKSGTTSQLADIWTSRYHLVGNSCQVFGWGKGKFSYTCSITSPSEAVAMEKYSSAKTLLGSCLGNSWSLKERPRINAKGSVAIYSSTSASTVVATHAFETNGIFNDEWTNYIFVGDPKRIK